MSGKILSLLVLAALAWAGSAAGQPPVQPAAALPAPTDTNTVIVSVNGRDLTLGMVYWLQPNAPPQVIKQIADFWVTTQLLAAEAAQRGLTNSPKTQFLGQLSALQMYGRELLQQVQETAAVTEAEVADYYSKNKDTDPRLSEPERISFTHLLLKTQDEAQAALAQVKAGGDLRALARQLSKSFDAALGGVAQNLAVPFVKMRYSREVYDALAEAREGQVLGPIKTREGFEIARLDGKQPAMVKPLDAVKEQIKADLERRSRSTVVEKFIQALKAKAAPEIHKSEFLIQAEQLAPPMGPAGLGPHNPAPPAAPPPAVRPPPPSATPAAPAPPGATTSTQRFYKLPLLH